jgi:RsiW-degrading membrane proteinase PrsW (M82 family)
VHLAVVLLVAAALTGCSSVGLAGTNDAALEYAVDPDPTTQQTSPAHAARDSVKARLASAQIVADVDVTPNGLVHVVVDRDMAGAVDDLVRWRGGLAVYRLDQNAGDEGKAPAGRQPIDDVAATARRIAEIVKTAPTLILGVGADAIQSIAPVDYGRALALELAPQARARLVALQEGQPKARVALVRGPSLLAEMPVQQAAQAPLVLSFGDGITSFARAHRTRILLLSPVLPPMHLASATHLPTRAGLAAACAVLPFVLSFAWLVFVRRFDRARPEPAWLVVATFVLGGLSVVPAALVELGLASATPWLEPSVWTLGGQLWAFPLALVAFTLITGAVEEACKWLGAWSLAWQRREFDEPVDGIVYGCASALGFAAVENIKYFALGRMSGVVIAVRAFMTVPAHMFFGALWGYAMGQTLVSRRPRVGLFFALAALAHGTFDASLSIEGTQLAAAWLVVGLALAFVVLLQRALRHGAVPHARATARERTENLDSVPQARASARERTENLDSVPQARASARERTENLDAVPREAPPTSMESPPPTEPMPASVLARTSFRVGSPFAFYGSAAAMMACAFALMVLGTAYELLQHRIGLVFVAMATTFLALFGGAAYAASETIPLDVVIDPQGLTFAGRRTPWGAITGLAVEASGRSKAFVSVQGQESIVRLGPVRHDTAQKMVHAIEAAAGWLNR